MSLTNYRATSKNPVWPVSAEEKVLVIGLIASGDYKRQAYAAKYFGDVVEMTYR